MKICKGLCVPKFKSCHKVGSYVSKLSHRLGVKSMSKEVSWFIITLDEVRKGTMITLHVIVLLESFKKVRAPQICCASYSNRLERSCHLWASTFFLNFGPYPLMYAYFPPFVCLHSIHDLCIIHSVPGKLQISLLHKISPSLRKRCADLLATKSMLLSFATQNPVAMFLLRIP
jgi:hypothetical protein